MNPSTRDPEELRMDAQDMLQTMSEERHRQLSPQKYRIVLIGKTDAFYLSRKGYIGEEGTILKFGSNSGPWTACEFVFDNPEICEGYHKDFLFFHRVVLKKLGKRKILVE